ncbi:MAG: aldo/keto reductase [Spirochaetaceae bacterium]|nr:MAG: aldo/keto reductase [Spirochaetaceae bacterium]
MLILTNFVNIKFPKTPGQKTYNAVRTALYLGYRAFDTAAAYNNEEDVGRAIRDGAVDPKEIFITTKVWISDHGYDNALRAIGVSNFLEHHLETLLEKAAVPPAVNQIEFHPFNLQPALLEFCRS